MNSIVIFGSTGQTGLCAIQAAVKKGIKVRAFVRDPSLLPEDLKEKVEIFKGDSLNYENVLEAIRGTDGVCVTLGTRKDLGPTTVLSESMKNITKAMKELNVSIISTCFSSFLFYEVDKVPAIFTEINKDHQREFDVLKASKLNFIAVFPPHIADQPPSSYITEFDKSPGRIVSKYDLGQFLIDSLSLPEFYGRVCGIISKT